MGALCSADTTAITACRLLMSHSFCKYKFSIQGIWSVNQSCTVFFTTANSNIYEEECSPLQSWCKGSRLRLGSSESERAGFLGRPRSWPINTQADNSHVLQEPPCQSTCGSSATSKLPEKDTHELILDGHSCIIWTNPVAAIDLQL